MGPESWGEWEGSKLGFLQGRTGWGYDPGEGAAVCADPLTLSRPRRDHEFGTEAAERFGRGGATKVCDPLFTHPPYKCPGPS